MGVAAREKHHRWLLLGDFLKIVEYVVGADERKYLANARDKQDVKGLLRHAFRHGRHQNGFNVQN